MRKRFFSIIVCVVMLFTMNVTAFAAETQENYSETEKTMTFPHREEGRRQLRSLQAAGSFELSHDR